MKDHSVLIGIAIIVTAVVTTVIVTTAIACRHVEKMAELGYQEDITYFPDPRCRIGGDVNERPGGT